MRLLSSFNEKEARDELGIGSIRDSIADQLFPGTSTIQTRLRYMFFVPWVYAKLESQGVAAASFAAAGQEAEGKLLEHLIRNVASNETGVIGRDTREQLNRLPKRLPSSVYWAGTGAWGLRRFTGTQQQYFAQIPSLLNARRARLRREEAHDRVHGHDTEAANDTWHPRLIALMPKAFPDGVNLELTPDEAALLLDQWRIQQPQSLLTWLALDAAKTQVMPFADWIWAHPKAKEFPESIRLLLADGQRFSALVEGAALLYNLQLAELGQRDDRVNEYSPLLTEWADQHLPLLRDWDLGPFWARVVGKGHQISEETRRFVQAWLDSALDAGEKVGSSQIARSLIELRETRLKGSRSRFKNRAALNQWGGGSSLLLLNYRWPTASRFLQEWHKGMNGGMNMATNTGGSA